MLEELLAWIVKLQPRQRQELKDAGSGNVQAGRVDGGVSSSVQTITQHFETNIYVATPRASTTEAGQTSTPVPSADRVGEHEAKPHPTVPTCDDATPASVRLRQLRHEMWELLGQMDRMPEGRRPALDFMEREFQTRTFKELGEAQLYRAVRWARVVLGSKGNGWHRPAAQKARKVP